MLFRSLISQMAELQPTDVVLDAGSGPGFVAHTLAGAVRVTIGLDLSPEMVRLAYLKAPEGSTRSIHATVGDIQLMPLERAAIDLVVCRWVMHHCADPSIAVAEMRRVCRDGGRLVICDTAAPEDPDLAHQMNEIEKLRDPTHARNLSHSEWAALLGKFGFIVDVEERSRVHLEFCDWVERAATPAKHVRELRRTFESPQDDLREAFKIRPEGSRIFFSWPVSVMRGRKRGG